MYAMNAARLRLARPGERLLDPPAHSVTPSSLATSTDVLVAASREVDEHRLTAAHARGDARDVGDGVRGLERRHDPLELGEQVKRVERLAVLDPHVRHAAGVVPEGVLGTDRGVVEAGRHRVRRADLAVLVLEDVAARPVQDAGGAAGEARRVLAQARAAPAGLDPDQLDVPVRDERREDPGGVRASADARHHQVRERAVLRADLQQRLAPDHGLELPHHHRVGVRARGPSRGRSGWSRRWSPSPAATR